MSKKRTYPNSLIPKKEHIHIVTDTNHKKILGNLGEKYGSMTKAFEFAIDAIANGKAIGSCSECSTRIEAEAMEKFRELLNIISFTGENIQELNDYFRGSLPLRELILRSRQKAYEFGKKYHNFLNIPSENTYENLLASLEEYRKRTRLFKAIEVDKYSKKIIARVNDVFKNLPILVTTGLIGFLESFNFTFDIDLFQAEIILNWLNPEIYALEKGRIEEKILAYIENSEQYIKPYLLKKGLVLVTPDLLDWFIQNLFDYQIVPPEISYTFANLTVGEIKVKDDPNEIARKCVNILKGINIADSVTTEIDEINKSFHLSISCVKPNLCKLVLNGLIHILAKYGWKLKQQKIEYRTLQVVFYYVGEEDPSILEPLYINNFMAYQNQQFETLRVVSMDEFENISEALYERDPNTFREICHKQGIKIGNAIKQLAKIMPQFRDIALQVIPQLLKSLRNPEDISYFSENNSFIIILKKMNFLTLERLGSIISGAMETFGYSNVKSKIIGNKVTIEFVRPFEIEKIFQKGEVIN